MSNNNQIQPQMLYYSFDNIDCSCTLLLLLLLLLLSLLLLYSSNMPQTMKRLAVASCNISCVGIAHAACGSCCCCCYKCCFCYAWLARCPGVTLLTILMYRSPHADKLLLVAPAAAAVAADCWRLTAWLLGCAFACGPRCVAFYVFSFHSHVSLLFVHCCMCCLATCKIFAIHTSIVFSSSQISIWQFVLCVRTVGGVMARHRSGQSHKYIFDIEKIFAVFLYVCRM